MSFPLYTDTGSAKSEQLAYLRLYAAHAHLHGMAGYMYAERERKQVRKRSNSWSLAVSGL